MKSEVYSWRVSKETKMALETEAREAGMTFAALLDRMAEDWLRSRRSVNGDDEQTRLHAAAADVIGSIAGGRSHRAENAREAIRDRLRKKNGR